MSESFFTAKDFKGKIFKAGKFRKGSKWDAIKVKPKSTEAK